MMNTKALFLPLFLVVFLTGCKPNTPMQRDRELPIHKIFLQHEVEQQKKCRMKLVTAGTPRREKIDHLALHYILFRKMKIPEMRELLVSSIEDFLTLVNNEESLQKHLKKHPVTYNDIKFNIGCGTKNGGFQEPPFLAYAYLEDGIVHYCYRDEMFGNFIEEEDLEEPYETALMLLRKNEITD